MLAIHLNELVEQVLAKDKLALDKTLELVDIKENR